MPRGATEVGCYYIISDKLRDYPLEAVRAEARTFDADLREAEIWDIATALASWPRERYLDLLEKLDVARG